MPMSTFCVTTHTVSRARMCLKADYIPTKIADQVPIDKPNLPISSLQSALFYTHAQGLSPLYHRSSVPVTAPRYSILS